MIDLKRGSDDHVHLIEFIYNICFYSSICMASYDALYECRCRSSICWFEVGETALIRSDLVHDAMELHEREAESYICKTFQDLE